MDDVEPYRKEEAMEMKVRYSGTQLDMADAAVSDLILNCAEVRDSIKCHMPATWEPES